MLKDIGKFHMYFGHAFIFLLTVPVFLTADDFLLLFFCFMKLNFCTYVPRGAPESGLEGQRLSKTLLLWEVRLLGVFRLVKG